MAQTTRTVYWHEDAEMWYDVEKDADIRNLRPANIAPLQLNEAQIRKIVTNLVDERFDKFEDLKLLIRDEWIPIRTKQVLAAHVVMTDHYFVNDPTKLVSYAYVREVIARTDRDVEHLRARVEKLERPWWKRWFRR